MTSRNDITGDAIKSKVGSQSAFDKGWDIMSEGVQVVEVAKTRYPVMIAIDKVLFEDLSKLGTVAKILENAIEDLQNTNYFAKYENKA